MVIIILPLVWVFMMSIKSRAGRDARQLLAAKIRLHALQLRLREDRHAAGQPVQQHLRHRRHGSSHNDLRRAWPATRSSISGRGAAGSLSRRFCYLSTSRFASSRSSASTRSRIISTSSTPRAASSCLTSRLNLAISVLIMRSVFQLVPHELIEAAKIDGAGPWKTLWLVGLPMVRNGLVVVFIVNFVTAWGEFLLCTTLTNDQDVRTMPVVLAGRPGWPRAMVLAGPRSRLRPRRDPRSRRLHFRPEALLQGPHGRRCQRIGLVVPTTGERPLLRDTGSPIVRLLSHSVASVRATSTCRRTKTSWSAMAGCFWDRRRSASGQATPIFVAAPGARNIGQS